MLASRGAGGWGTVEDYNAGDTAFNDMNSTDLIKYIVGQQFDRFCQSQARLKPKRCLGGFIFTINNNNNNNKPLLCPI